jgi:hypothetical protein
MSHPWWKTAPPPPANGEVEKPATAGLPWKEERVAEPVRTYGRNRIKCSAPGCNVESSEITTATLGPGLKPYCEHHATGRDSIGRELFWKLPCACGRVGDGFVRAAGGFMARHTEARCIERTMSSQLEGSNALPLVCACGKSQAGVQRDQGGVFESHAARECTEQTTRIG